MSRRAQQFFKLSFLDILSGALGAILFLFIIVDKAGGEKEIPSTGGTQLTEIYQSLDTVTMRLHGIIPDTLKKLYPGRSLLVVISDILPAPDQPKCPPQEPCKGRGGGPVCLDPERHKKPDCPDPGHHKQVVCVDPSVHDKLLCDDPGCSKTTIQYQGDPLALAYHLGFSLTSANPADEIDLQVCKDGVCVSGAKKQGAGMRWLNLKEGGFFAKPRTWNEIILAEGSLQPGTYTCYARVDCKSAATSNIELVVGTKKQNMPRQVATFSKKLDKCGNQWIVVGAVIVGSDYSITKKIL